MQVNGDPSAAGLRVIITPRGCAGCDHESLLTLQTRAQSMVAIRLKLGVGQKARVLPRPDVWADILVL